MNSDLPMDGPIMSLGDWSGAFISVYGSILLFCFILGYYLSYLLLKKRVKKIKLYYILFYFLGGIIFTFFTFSFAFAVFGVLLTQNSLKGLVNELTLPFIVLIEIILIWLHYRFITNQRTKKKIT